MGDSSLSCDRRAFVLSVAAAALGGPAALAPGAPPADESGGRAELRASVAFYTAVASRLEFRTQDRPGEPLKFEDKPVLVYSHPSGLKGTHGAFYIWTRDGRPEVVGSIWSYKPNESRRTIVHEFDSLTTSPLAEMTIAGGVWSQKRVIEPREVPDAPPPAPSPRARATQIKQLAGRFEGYSMTNETEVKLRMLTKPLYQSRSREGAARDFAFFCFFADWDPEILLLIESRQTSAGPRWHYSAARFNVCPMWLDYDNKRVWKVERVPINTLIFGDGTGPFFGVHEIAAQPAQLGKSATPEPRN
jgi:hypothetical protein